MNRRKVLLKEIIRGFPKLHLPNCKAQAGILRDELAKYESKITDNTYAPVKNYLAIVNKTKYNQKDLDKIDRLKPQIIKIINDITLPDDYYTEITGNSDDEEVITEEEDEEDNEKDEKDEKDVKENARDEKKSTVCGFEITESIDKDTQIKILELQLKIQNLENEKLQLKIHQLYKYIDKLKRRL